MKIRMLLKPTHLLLLLPLCTLSVSGQQANRHTEWLTGARDSSFSTRSDYEKNIRKYPFIKIVPDSSVPEVKEYRNLVYAHIGARALHLDAFIPEGNDHKPRQAVLLVHGGGWRSGDRSQHTALAQHLAAHGIACFTVEYRLSTEAFYPAAIYDLKAAIRWLRANADTYKVDTGKVNLLGFSAGGELAAFVGLTNGLKKFEGTEGNNDYSSKVNAVIDIDGTLSFIHPEASETKSPLSVGASCQWLGFKRTENIDLWKEASPLTYADNNHIPFLFLNSELKRMHAGRDDFKKLMDENDVPVIIKEFPDAPHAFCLYEPWFSQVVQEICMFVNSLPD